MPAQEEGVHQMFGEPGRRAGEPEQGAHRGAQEAEGALLGEWGEIGMIAPTTMIVNGGFCDNTDNTSISLSRFEILCPDASRFDEERTFRARSLLWL